MNALLLILPAILAILLVTGIYCLVLDYRLRKRENPVFDALVARVKDSGNLTRDELITLHDELVNWHKRTGLYIKDVVRYLSYLRGRIGVKPL